MTHLQASESYVASTADFRNGIVLEIDGHLYQMVYFQQ